MHYMYVFVGSTCLCTGHEVSLWLDNRNGIFLDRGWSGVATQSDVTHDNLTHVHVLELHSTTTKTNIYDNSGVKEMLQLIHSIISLDL